MSKGVPEHVWMQMIETSLLCSPPEHLTDAVVSHHTARTEPECAVSGKSMFAPFSEIPFDRLPCLISKRTCTWPAALSKYDLTWLSSGRSGVEAVPG